MTRPPIPAEQRTTRPTPPEPDFWATMRALERGEGYPKRPLVIDATPAGPPKPHWSVTALLWVVLALTILYAVAVFMSGRASALEVGETEPLDPASVYVVDGDTIRVAGVSYRLTGFDAPEIGRRAECESEVALGYDAKARVVDLVHAGKPVTLTRSACACPPNAPEETMGCNYGRRCGTLRVAGEDVGAILMREGLAKSYAYRWPHPPPKPRWCVE